MTITSGSKIEIIFPIITIFDIRNSEEVIKEIKKKVIREDEEGGVEWLLAVV
jgi:hypothetical protein